MPYKCKICEYNAGKFDSKEWCPICKKISMIKFTPPKRDYTHELIFSKYLEDKCPVCDEEVDADNFHSHTESGGKCMAKHFQCSKCFSEYTVGYRRRYDPITSEITNNTIYR